jgi:hypothetical protein
VRAALRITAVALGWTFVGLLLAEWSLRHFAPQELRTPMFQLDRYVGDTLLPNTIARHRSADFDVTYHINAAGYRGTLYPIAKPPGTFRVVTLGDSFCFGHGVEDNQTFSYLLERELRARMHRDVQVINLGVMGYGTEQELIRFERQGLAYHPDAVVLAFFSNDPDDDRNSQLFEVRNGKLAERMSTERASRYKDLVDHIPGYTWLVEHSELAAFVRERIWQHISQGGRNGMTLATVKAATPRDYSMTGLLLDQFRNLAAQDHFKFVLLLVAGSGRTLTPGTPDFYVRQYGLSHGLPMVDSSAWLAGYLPAHHLREHDAFYPHDGHWKPWVHATVAGMLAQTILAQETNGAAAHTEVAAAK